ncbi:MAG: homogentisate 1,2-dioxygenase [Pseudomonadota bacterium]
MAKELNILTGFGNEHASESLPGALPVGRNSPQKAPYGLYPELISGTAFTAPRHQNLRSWYYRIRPSVKTVSPVTNLSTNNLRTAPDDSAHIPTVPLRWDPLPADSATGVDFVSGWHTMVSNGSAVSQHGCGVHVYVCDQSMEDRYYFNIDGELLIVAQMGQLRFRTEAGVLDISPGEICVIPRGLKFAVDVLKGPARGYICENYGAPLSLPELGPIGSNALANPRDFEYPSAAYEDKEGPYEQVFKSMGQLFSSEISHSPLDVVAWHGSYAPYKYDLTRFNTIGSVSFDHPDPSIFTVLTSQSDTPGVANVDFVIFPPRWLVAEDTFRPPWYHRNVMSEYMGLIYGVYDAKPEGFVPGGGSLHNCMLPHGPDADAFEHASNKTLEPEKLDHTMAFMFESRYPFLASDFAMNGGLLQGDYVDCWREVEKHFSG